MITIVSTDPQAALTVAEAQSPRPGPGQVVIDVRAIGVGRIDLIMRQMMPTSFVPGIELAGMVTETAPDVDPAWCGRRVFARLPSGAYAEQVVANSGSLIRLPDEVPFEKAVAAGINAIVAHLCLVKSQTVAGELVVVRGARGGIGHLVVQMAKTLGAEVIDSPNGGPAPSADVVIDLVAGPDTGAHLEELRANGRYVIAGISAGMPPPDFANALMSDFRRSRSITTLSLDTIAEAGLNKVAATVLADVGTGRIAPVIAEALQLNDANLAHSLLSEGGLKGKIILVP